MGEVIKNYLIMALILASPFAEACDKSCIKSKAIRIAKSRNVDPVLVLAIIEVESNYNVRAKGKYGEVGLLQLHPKFFPNARYDIDHNLQLGIGYIAKLKQHCSSRDHSLYFVRYNVGPNKTVKNLFKTRYAKKVLAAYARIKNQYK